MKREIKLATSEIQAWKLSPYLYQVTLTLFRIRLCVWDFNSDSSGRFGFELLMFYEFKDAQIYLDSIVYSYEIAQL